MECSAVRKLLTAAADAELDLRESTEVDSHLRGCAGCRAQFESERALRGAIGRNASYIRAPAALEARIRAALPPTSAPHASVPPRRSWQWPVAIAALASLFAIVSTIGLYVALSGADDRVGDEIVSSHVRSLLANHAVDIASSDQHTVKPWFAGKLDFSPPVRDFASDGFPLVGGRLDYLDRHPVATLVYRYREHTIDVFVRPLPGRITPTPPVTLATLRGFNVAHATGSGMEWWAVSDVSPDVLSGFLARIARGN